MIPTLAVGLWFINMNSGPRSYAFGNDVFDFHEALDWITSSLLTVGSVPLVLLLFFHLRAIAKRARSAQLMEYCAIVAFGTSAALLYIAMAELTTEKGFEDWPKGFQRWMSSVSLSFFVTLSAIFCLFILWSLYLLICFAISFDRASRQLRTKWKRDDRALEPP